jgi:hypothetical protein
MAAARVIVVAWILVILGLLIIDFIKGNRRFRGAAVLMSKVGVAAVLTFFIVLSADRLLH